MDKLIEEDDGRAELRAIGRPVPYPDRHVQRVFLDAVRIQAVPRRSDFRQLSVEMDDPGTPGPLVEIVHVLGEHRHVVELFQRRNGSMGRIRRDLQERSPAPCRSRR